MPQAVEWMQSKLKGTSCTTKEPQLRNIESVLHLQKNAKTILVKLLAEEGPGSIYQLCYRVPAIGIKQF